MPWKFYKPKLAKTFVKMRPYIPGENMDNIQVSKTNKSLGCPKSGDMIKEMYIGHKKIYWLIEATDFINYYDQYKEYWYTKNR